MIKYVLSLSIVLFSFGLFGQEKKTVDVVQLKDGSTLVGKFLNATDTSYLFSLASVDSIYIQKNFVQTIHFDVEDFNANDFRSSRFKINRKKRIHKQGGFFGNADFGIVSGEEVHWHTTLTFGKRISPNYYLGLQVGKENIVNANTFFWQTDGIWSVGIYNRYYPLESQVRPFVSARIGYGFIDDDFRMIKSGGLNLMPGLGIHFPSRNGFHFIISIHQYFQKTEGLTNFNDPFQESFEVNYDIWYNRTVFKIGIEF